MIAVVLPSIVFKSVAAAIPADTVTATPTAWVIPAELSAFAISAAKPVIPLTAAALMIAVVLASKVFRFAALTVASATVMA